MGYCFTCGWWYEADLDPRTKMCRWCRDNWRPAGSRPGDLGTRAFLPARAPSADLTRRIHAADPGFARDGPLKGMAGSSLVP